MRKSLAVAALLAATAACTSLLGDFSLGSGGTGPGDSGPTEGGSSGEGGTCDVSGSDVSVYVGQTASLSATSSSPGATFSWSLTAPPGSNAQLQNGSTATPSLTPDVPGAYKLVLSASAPGCASNSTLVTVTATLPRVLFAQGTIGGGAQATYVVADLDGGNAQAVMCPDTENHVPNEIASYAAYAARAYDFWEAPAGTPSKYAAFTLDYSGGYSTHLFAGTTASSCDGSAPKDLGASGFGPGQPFGVQPHFSPDGTRFVVYDAQSNIVSYAADGSEHHTIAPYSSTTPGFDPTGHDGVTHAYPPRVEWLSSSQAVAWARSTASGWQIVEANDTTNAQPTIIMNCTGVTPREIAMLADGSVIASYRAAPAAPENLYQLTVDSSQNCKVGHQYTNLAGASGSVATDFAVSPDGKTIAYLQLDTTTQDAAPWLMPPDASYPGGYVYTVPVSGGTPKQISSEPAIFGPRWIGGGTLLVFTRLDGTHDGGLPAASVVVVAPNGTGEQVVARGDGVTSFVSTSGSAACSATPGRTAPVIAGLASLMVGLAAALRRRRR
jgi:MYXO-CTERM domain-containing protein